MGSIPSHAVELLPLVYQTGREMIGCRGQALSPLSLERSFRHRDSKFNWFTVWLRENWLYDCKLPCALIVGHEIITPMFWFWDMDIDTFKCPRVGGKVRSDVCFPALTCSLLEKVRCIVVPSWSLVLGTHHCWYLSRPQSYGPCQGFHLHPFIETLSLSDPFRLCSPWADSPTRDSQEGASQPLELWPSVQPYLCPFSSLQFVMGCLQGCGLTKCPLGSRPHTHRGAYRISHLTPAYPELALGEQGCRALMFTFAVSSPWWLFLQN